ncbi:MAG TPA: NRDE family protein [Thermoanaerobaculia bacterium]|nr:NRDE family protein [Thermoanaerobaculia bacterium]
MCLIALAIGVSRFPLIVAANRDEDYERPTLPATFWPDAPDILGGRDALHLGSWLAVTRGGRFAAVTNLKGASRDPRKRSRGELVSDFVRGSEQPLQYVTEVAARADQYAGFHLIAGELGGDVAQYSGVSARLPDGIHAISNAPAGVRWPKVDIAAHDLEGLLRIDDANDLVTAALRFLSSPRGNGHVEGEVFVAGERYGTRSSTVIVFDGEHVHFAEQSFMRGGARNGAPREFRFPLAD